MRFWVHMNESESVPEVATIAEMATVPEEAPQLNKPHESYFEIIRWRSVSYKAWLSLKMRQLKSQEMRLSKQKGMDGNKDTMLRLRCCC